MLEPLPPAQQQPGSAADATSAEGATAEQGGVSPAPDTVAGEIAAAGSAEQQEDAEISEACLPLNEHHRQQQQATGDAAGPPAKAQKLEQQAAEAGCSSRGSGSRAVASVLDRLDRVAGHLLGQIEPAQVAYVRCGVAKPDVEVGHLLHGGLAGAGLGHLLGSGTCCFTCPC
jgi:hypothetical protein